LVRHGMRQFFRCDFLKRHGNPIGSKFLPI
jgi:hypothetical protein